MKRIFLDLIFQKNMNIVTDFDKLSYETHKNEITLTLFNENKKLLELTVNDADVSCLNDIEKRLQRNKQIKSNIESLNELLENPTICLYDYSKGLDERRAFDDAFMRNKKIKIMIDTLEKFYFEIYMIVDMFSSLSDADVNICK